MTQADILSLIVVLFTQECCRKCILETQTQVNYRLTKLDLKALTMKEVNSSVDKATNGKIRKVRILRWKENPKKRKLQKKALQKELQRARNDGIFHSTALSFSSDKQGRRDRAAFKSMLKKSSMYIVKNHLDDNMKAPRNNEAQSALQAKASFDIYFSYNIADTDLPGFVVRSNYGSFSGDLSIGLDPRHSTINKIFPDLHQLCMLIRKHVMRHYQKRGECYNCEFNQVSIKLYFNEKQTNEHTDIEFNNTHTAPLETNSQVPNTPVAIAVFGDTKFLQFIQYKQQGKKETRTGKSVTFVQESGALMVLDPKDEELNGLDNTFWKHAARLENQKHGVSISLMFRVVQSQRTVHAETGKYYKPTVCGTGLKEAQFDRGWSEIVENNVEEYNETCKRIREKIVNRLSLY